MYKFGIYFCIILAIVVMATVAVRTQVVKPSEAEIMLNVTVSDKAGNWIIGLQKENFVITADDEIQNVTSITSEEVPISIGIMIDRSGSVQKIDSQIPGSVIRFLKQCNPDNEYFLSTFGVRQDLAVDFTQNTERISQGINNLFSIVPSSGNTAIYDSLKWGFERAAAGRFKKKILLILTDAEDNQSKKDFSDLKKIARTTDVILYVINFSYALNRQSEAYSVGLVNELAGITGGRTFYPRNERDLNFLMYNTAVELRSQYRIGFRFSSKSNAKVDDKWHHLKVKVEPPQKMAKRGKLLAISRVGFYSQTSAK